eukprot:scaffold3648_cov149-Amphora_coffeaeformis.AAC.4
MADSAVVSSPGNPNPVDVDQNWKHKSFHVIRGMVLIIANMASCSREPGAGPVPPMSVDLVNGEAVSAVIQLLSAAFLSLFGVSSPPVFLFAPFDFTDPSRMRSQSLMAILRAYLVMIPSVSLGGKAAAKTARAVRACMDFRGDLSTICIKISASACWGCDTLLSRNAGSSGSNNSARRLTPS